MAVAWLATVEQPQNAHRAPCGRNCKLHVAALKNKNACANNYWRSLSPVMYNKVNRASSLYLAEKRQFMGADTRLHLETEVINGSLSTYLDHVHRFLSLARHALQTTHS